MWLLNLIVKIFHQIYARKNIHNIEKSVGYPVIPNIRVSVTCDGNSCYNRGRCLWAEHRPWSPAGLTLQRVSSHTTLCVNTPHGVGSCHPVC